MSDISDLIARLEKATGPDRELDIFIGNTTRVVWNGLNQKEIDYLIGEIPNEKGWKASGARGHLEICPRFTASLDAALTLVPEGWAWAIHQYHDCSGPHADAVATVSRVTWGASEENFFGKETARHPIVAIALCISALKVRTTKTGD